MYLAKKCCFAWLLVSLYQNNYHNAFKSLQKRIAGLISKLKRSYLTLRVILGHQIEQLITDNVLKNAAVCSFEMVS